MQVALFTISGERVVARLKKQLFSRIIKQEVAFFDVNKTGMSLPVFAPAGGSTHYIVVLSLAVVVLLMLSPIAGELVNRLSADCTVLQNAVTVNISMVLRELASAIGGITILFVISWKVLPRPFSLS